MNVIHTHAPVNYRDIHLQRRGRSVLAYTFRCATKNDLPFLWQMLARSAYTSCREAQSDPKIRMYLEGWKRPGDVGFIALGEDQLPHGAIWLREFTEEAWPFHYVSLAPTELVVGASRSGEGVGSLLLQALLQFVDSNSPKSISLNVRQDNPAVRLYLKHGFQVFREITNRVGSTSYIMIRDRN